MRIPKRFTILGHTYSVVYDETLETHHGNIGEARYLGNQIALQPPRKGFSKSHVESTFCHELVHLLLYHAKVKGPQGDLTEDEDAVDLIASLLHQALSSATYGKE